MYTANFFIITTNFIEPDANRGARSNPRWCLAIRPAGTDEPYDITLNSMLEWQQQQWSKKDFMSDDPKGYCGKAWADQEEEED